MLMKKEHVAAAQAKVLLTGIQERKEAYGKDDTGNAGNV